MTTDDLSRLHNLEVRLYELTTRSHLRVGAGEGTADVATDNPIIRALIWDEASNSDSRIPYLPASSLHGVIRAWVEKALRSKQEPLTGTALKEKVEAIANESHQQTLLGKIRAELEAVFGKSLKDDALYEHWQVYTNPYVSNPLSDVDKCERILLDDETLSWKREWLNALGVHPPCAVSRVFGYMGQRGRVKFSHAWPTTSELPLDVITRVAINRLTGAADEGKLFDLEAIPPGVRFHFFVVMENMTADDKQHFEMGIKALNLQLAGLGAHSTVGFGMVDIRRHFTATISPHIFSQDVEAEFIRPHLAGNGTVALDLARFPEFFRALALAQASETGQYLDGKISFA